MSEEGGQSFLAGGVVYYWPRGFLLLVPRFVVDRGDRPTRRPSIRLMLARQDDVEIELADGTWVRGPAVLMGSQVKRRQIIAMDTGFVLLDVAVATPEHAVLAPLLAPQPVLLVPRARFAALSGDLERAAAGGLAGHEVPALRQQLVHAVAGVRPAPPDYDPRVETALAILEERRLEEVSLETLAAAVHLSPGRLRHLFKQQVGCTISHYARTAAVWKALSQWARGGPLSAVAHDVGFHDYAHSHHAFKEMFGFAPSLLSRRSGLRMIRSE
jgi:AraC-like DNA-binding protein